MALDGIYLHLLKNEISNEVVGSFVDKVYNPSREEMLISFRTREGSRKILLSCKADSSRINITNLSYDNPKKPSMLTILFRKYLVGSKLREIIQDGCERSLEFIFDGHNEIGDNREVHLIIEIMGRYSNIILTDSNYKIIESIKHVDEEMSQVRQILPGLTYKTPPKQNKLDIFENTDSDILWNIDKSIVKKSKAYGNVIQGLSPIVCREFDEGMTISDLREYISNPIPIVVISDKPVDFTYFKVSQYGDVATFKEFKTFSECVDYFYKESSHVERIKQRANDLYRHLEILKERSIRKTINRENELKDCVDREKYKHYADLINSNLHLLKKGASIYEVVDYYSNGEMVSVPVDSALTPVENAQKYYKVYRKKQTAEKILEEFIKQSKEETIYLDSVLDSLLRAQTSVDINQIREELYNSGYLRRNNKNKIKIEKNKPKKYISSEGFEIYVGKNNVQNDQLTLKNSTNYDLWFHVKDTPGSHVVVKAVKGKDFTDLLIREAALLAASNSKASSSSNVAVDYTTIKNVKKPNGAKPGMVIYDVYNTEYVTPDESQMKGIKEVE